MSAFAQEVRQAFDTHWLPPEEPADTTPLWTPLPGPQTDAFTSQADELFYGGAAGGGKTDLVLGLAITAHHSSVIFRTEFAQFRGPEGIIERSKEVIGSRGDLNESLYQWRGLPGGRSFEFAGVSQPKHLNKWKGRAHDLKAFDEITEFAEAHYRFLIGWLRTGIIGQRTRVVCTGNPPTTSIGQWVIQYWAPWLDKTHPHPARPGELRWFATLDGKDVELLEPRPVQDSRGEWVRPRSRTFIPARVEDNPYYMRTGYIDVLNNLPEPLRSQLRFGDFEATQDDDPWQVIPTAWVRAAQARWLEQAKPDLPLTAMGVDPSRGGKDQFCLAKRYGHWVDRVEKHDAKEAPDGQAGAQIVSLSLGADRTVPVAIDIIGTAGSSVFDQSRDLGIRAIGLNGAEKSVTFDRSGRLKFKNKRAEWHWRLREWLDPSSGQAICLPPDPQLLADLCAPRWRITPRGVQIEDKGDIKERIGRSPDVGEAVIYAFADDTGAGAGFLAYAQQQVTAAKARIASRPPGEAPPNEMAEPSNPWLQALPRSHS